MAENLVTGTESDDDYEYIELKDGEDLPEGFELVDIAGDDLQPSGQPVAGDSRKVEDILQELEKEVVPPASEPVSPIPLSSADLLAKEALKAKPEETVLISGEGENFEDFSGDANDEVLVGGIHSDPDPIYMPGTDEAETTVDSAPTSEIEAMPNLNDYRKLFDKTKKVDFFDGLSGESIHVEDENLSGYVLIVINKIPAKNNKVLAVSENVVHYSRTRIEEYQTYFLEESAGSSLAFDAPVSGVIIGAGSVLYFANIKEIKVG